MRANRTSEIKTALWALSFLLLVFAGAARSAFPLTDAAEKVPVVLDTDIGDDIDDTWALARLLKTPELDLRLVTTTHGKAVYRAKLICRILEAAALDVRPDGLTVIDPAGAKMSVATAWRNLDGYEDELLSVLLR